MKKAISAVCIFLMMLSFCSNAFAGENLQLNKLKRGAVNILSSPMEIPKQTKLTIDESKAKNKAYNPVWIFCGLVKGVAYMGGRIGSGTWDVLTFNLPIPADYAPLMTPEYVCDHLAGKKAE